MKKSLIMFSLLLFSICVFSQQKISYAYDAAGNRVKREIVLTTKSLSQEALPEIFTEEVAKRNIKIYPNPTDGFLKVDIDNLEGVKNCTITISTMNTGKYVYKKKVIQNVTDIDISNEPFGVYVMLIDIDGEYTSWKIMKK
jgi:hypothetical protein